MGTTRDLEGRPEAVAGALEWTSVEVLPSTACLADELDETYQHVYTTGPFQLPPNAGSLDWIVLNNDASSQNVRVTVFQGGVGMAKVPMPPGALTVTVGTGESTHNANTYPTGYVYEVQVETNSTQVFPYVSVWPGNFGESIPGTAITASSFLRQMPSAPAASTTSRRLVSGRTARVVTDAWHAEVIGSEFDSPPVVLSSIESFWGTNPAATRQTDVDTHGFKVRIEEEQSGNAETAHLPEVVGYVAAEPGVVHDELGNVIGEVGVRTVAQSDADAWHTVTLTTTFCTPVVIAQVMTHHGSEPCHVRIRNVDSGSFEFQIEEWDYLTGHHVAEDVGYLVLEARRHQLPAGQVVEAGHCTTNHSWEVVDLGIAHDSPPIVLTACQTHNGPQAVVTRERAITHSRFEVRLQEEEANDGIHTAETIGFVAIEHIPGRQTGADDTSPPVLNALSVNPTSVNTEDSAQVVTVTAHITDDLSGNAGAGYTSSPSQVRFRSPSGNQFVDAILSVDGNLDSGTPLDGTYQDQIGLPRFSESGTWTIDSILLVDQVGNTQSYDAAEAAAAGYTANFTIS